MSAAESKTLGGTDATAVFISHAEENKAVAELLCSTLEQRDVRCWIAPRDIPPGMDYPAAIAAGIRDSCLVVLVYSHYCNASIHVPKEIALALDGGIGILPVRLDKQRPTGNLEYLLSITQALDVPAAPTVDNFKRVADEVCARLGRSPVGSPFLERGNGTGARRGRWACLGAFCAVLLLAGWNEWLGPWATTGLEKAETAPLIHTHCWVTYDASPLQPDRADDNDVETVQAQLRSIHNAGFDGIVTFTSRGAFARVPALAHAAGLRVIAGIWNPRDREEVSLAVASREYVDAYCVGHNGVGRRYTLSELSHVMRLVRFRTGRPVATTEPLGRYVEDARLRALGDWLFPDVHVSLQAGDGLQADAGRDSAQTLADASTLVGLDTRDSRTILLKMVLYPYAGATGASLDAQASFFRYVLATVREVHPDLPHSVSLAFHSAFDLPGKTAWPCYEWDPFTGLLELDGTPRPATLEIVTRRR